MKFLQMLRDWSEVWAILIPLAVIIACRPRGEHIRPLVWYVIIAFLLNFTATFMVKYYYLVPAWMQIDGIVNNNILYNAHSITRVLCFSGYIMMIRHYRFPLLLRLLLVGYLVLVLLNFVFVESPFYLSTNLHAAESIVLLVMCLSYFLRLFQDESRVNWLKHPSFLVCAGISLYEVITFFIFLFFYPLSKKDQAFFVVTMRIYSYTFILLCILLALALYQVKKQSKKPNQPV